MSCTIRSKLAAVVSLQPLLVLPLLLMTVHAAPLFAQPFPAMDLGSLTPGGTNTPHDINRQHQVVGVSPNASPPFHHGYSWTPGGGIVALPSSSPAIRPFVGFAINAGGQIAGTADIGGNRIEAFRLTGTTLTLLGTLGTGLESDARGINIHGDVVGTCVDSTFGFPQVGFIHKGGVMSVAGQLREAWDINDSGFVCGVGGNPQGPRIWNSTTNVTTSLGTLGGSPFASTAVAINNANQVVGASSTSSSVTHAYVWSSTTGMVDLNASTTTESFALDINNSGEIVGTRGLLATRRAFYWSNGVTTDLNTWLPASSGWILQRATAISDDGCIVGEGLLNGQPRGWIMCIPEPATGSLAALTLVAVASFRTTRARRTAS
jgi:probable HAF family extracellular repeat protein